MSPTAAPSAAPATPGGAAEGRELVRLHRTGCFMGVDDTLAVYEDGAVELTARGVPARRAEASAEELERLRQLLDGPAFAALGPSYEADGADLCYYEITAMPGGGSSRTVTATDGAEHPPVLAELLATLSELRQRAR